MQSFFQDYHETKASKFQDLEIFKYKLVYDEYLDDLENISISTHMEIFNSDPVHDNYELYSLEGNEADVLGDMQKEALLPYVIKSGNTNHEFQES